MASAHEVAAYRATHSVAETCAHFGIKERAVFKACAKVRELQEVSATPVTTASRPVRRLIHRCASRPKYPRHRAPIAHKVVTLKKVNELDEVAGDDTTWACPYTHEEFPIIPGTTKRMWLAERRAAFLLHTQRRTPAPEHQSLGEVGESAPVPAPQKVQAASQSAPALAEKPKQSQTVPGHLHQQTPEIIYVKQYVRVRRDFKQGLLYQGLVFIARYGPPWQVWLGFVLGLLIILWCSV